MAKQRIILVLAVCFSIAVFTGQTLSQARSSKRTFFPPFAIDPRSLRGLTEEESSKEIEKWFVQRWQQQRKRSKERMDLMAKEADKRLLRITEQQWKLIETKKEKVAALGRESRIGARGWGGRDEQNFHWNRRSKGTFGTIVKTPDEMTEGERIAEELIDLLEDENSKEEEIRQKINALQRARENARKAKSKAKQELRKVLTTPRQEAVFLLIGYID